MGNHGLDALQFAEETELQHLDYSEGNLSQEDAYDLGIIDELGWEGTPSPFIDTVTNGADLYKWAYLFDHGSIEDLFGLKKRPRKVPTNFRLNDVELSSLKILVKKNKIAWSMRLGMAKQTLSGKRLTENQEKWMETNWRGGTKAFYADIKKYGKKVVETLETLNTLFDKIINL